jgi:hypothetical protein
VSGSPRSAGEAWRALEDAAWSAELKRIRGLSEADLDRELAHVGIDPNAARAIGQEKIEEAARAAGVDPASIPRDPPRPPTGAWVTPARRRSAPVLFLGAALVAAAAVLLLAWTLGWLGGR